MVFIDLSKLENRGLETELIWDIIDDYYEVDADETTRNPIYLKVFLNRTTNTPDKLGYYEADKFTQMVDDFSLIDLGDDVVYYLFSDIDNHDYGFINRIKKIVRDNALYIMKALADEFGWETFNDMDEDRIKACNISAVLSYMFYTELEKIEDEIQEKEHYYAKQIQKVFRRQAVRNRNPAI